MDKHDWLQLAKEAEQFKQSKLGMYLAQQALDEAMDASTELLNVNPTKELEIRDLQNKAKLYNICLGWVDELIAGGNSILELEQSEGE